MNSATRTLSKSILQPLQYVLDAAFFAVGIVFLLRFGQEVFPLAKFDPINILPKIKDWADPVMRMLSPSAGLGGGRSAQILPLGVSVVAFVMRFVVVGQIKKARNRMEEPQAETMFEAKRTPSGKISQGIEMADSEESREKLLRDLRDIEKKLKWSVKKRCTFLSIDVVGSTGMKQGKSQTDIAASFQAYEETLRKLGIADAMQPRLLKVQGGANAIAVLARGESDIGLTFLSEIHNDGVDIVGALPREICTPTALVGYVHTKSQVAEAARALLSFLASPEVADIYRSLGMVPGR